MRVSQTIWFFAFIVGPGHVCAETWYVNSNIPGGNQGTSWQNAFMDLQDALGVAVDGDEIWVAAGTYTPDRGTGDRTRAFEIVCGTRLYGGFGGWETAREQRDWVAHPTILTGDLQGDDGSQDCDQVSDCCRVHQENYCDDAECQELVCAIKPICCQVGDEWDSDCAALAASTCCHLGHWKRCENAFEVVRACDCDADTIFDGFVLERSFFHSNLDIEYSGVYSGSGIRVDRSSMRVSNTVFQNNIGYGILTTDGGALFVGCTLRGDHLASNGSASFVECDFFDGLYTMISVFGVNHFERCLIQGHQGEGEAFYAGDGQTTLNNCVISDNHAGGIKGRGLVLLNDTTISDNRSGIGMDGGRLEARHCKVSGNRGAISVSSSTALLEDCLIADNYTSQFILVASGRLDLVNCTLARNLNGDRDRPGFMAAYNSLSPSLITMTNTILWGGDEFSPEPDSLLREFPSGSSYVVNHSIIQGWSGAMGGEGNTGVSPQFADPDGLDDSPDNEDDDFRLAAGSPGINAGDPKFVPDGDETELEGHGRVLCGAVDIGAYEFGAGDFDCDQDVDLFDQSTWDDCMTNPRPSAVRPGCEAFDFKADSDIDLSDFALFQRVFVSH